MEPNAEEKVVGCLHRLHAYRWSKFTPLREHYPALPDNPTRHESRWLKGVDLSCKIISSDVQRWENESCKKLVLEEEDARKRRTKDTDGFWAVEES